MITPRLQCILNNVKGTVIADIGTDHAYIPIRLIQDGCAERVIASDVRKGPADTALENIRKYGLQDRIEIRLGSGYSVLSPAEADCIITAGMGGKLIMEIISADIETARASRLVLQPMNYQYELRKYLAENGFKITCEDISVEDFKVYNLICAENGTMSPSEKEIDYHLPPCLYSHKYFKFLYEKKKREFVKVINGLSKSNKRDNEKLNKYIFWLEELEKI